MSAQSLSPGAAPGAPAGKAVWLANLLCLAAAPSFALMALLTAIGGGPDPICSANGPGFHAGGMGAMYLMMSAFHLPAWLRKLRQR
ncbi:MAG: hypothetical protein V4508_19025 [Pseudomonadota bacterium]